MTARKPKAPAKGWGLRESILTFIPGNAVYRTMRARNARKGVAFILPLIIGFLVFMAKPLAESLMMSLSSVQMKWARATPARLWG